MKTNICVMCIYYSPLEDQPREDCFTGECRRYAPNILMGSGAGYSDQKFPHTLESYWCGEFIDTNTGKAFMAEAEEQE